jgi:hypothetical protein
MSSSGSGKSISTSRNEAEITAITRHGLWILIAGREYFIPFADYRQFRRAPLDQIYDFSFHAPGHLHWPQLDIDIELEALETPEQYPLTFTEAGDRAR